MKKSLLFLFLTFIACGIASAQVDYAVYSNNNPGASPYITKGSIASIYGLVASASADGALTSISVPLEGTFQASDIANIKLYAGTIHGFQNAVELAEAPAVGSGNSVSFTTTISITGNQPVYLYIAIQASETAVSGNTISVPGIPLSNFEFLNEGIVAGSNPTDGGLLFEISDPLLTVSTVIESDQTLPGGTSNYFVYESEITISRGEATMQGFSFTPTGSFQTGEVSALKVYVTSFSQANKDELLNMVEPDSIITNVVSGQEITVTLNPEMTLEELRSFNIYILADFASNISTTSGFQIAAPDAASDLHVASGEITGSFSAGPVITFGNPVVNISNNPIPASNVGPGNIIALSRTAISVENSSTILESATFTTTGNYTTNDLFTEEGSYYLFYSTSPVFDQNADGIDLGYIRSNAAVGPNGQIVFDNSNTTGNLIPTGNGYILLLSIIHPNATIGNTLGIAAMPSSQLSFAGTETGATTLSANGPLTITQPTVNVSTAPLSNATYAAGGRAILYKMAITVEGADVSMRSLRMPTAGTFTSTDVQSFGVRVTTGQDEFATSFGIGWSSSISAGDELVFQGFDLVSLPAGQTSYVYITADISNSTTTGKTIQLLEPLAGNLIFNGTTPTISLSDGPVITIGSGSLSVERLALSSANVMAGEVNHLVYAISVTSATTNSTLYGISIPFAGSFVETDFENIKLWQNSTNSFTGSTLLGTEDFALNQNNSVSLYAPMLVNAGETMYYFITLDVDINAGQGNTINVPEITSNILNTPINQTGFPLAEGPVQTISGVVSSMVNFATIEKANVYPNPSTGKFQMTFTETTDRQINIINALGENIRKETTSSNMTHIDISNLPSGKYLIQVIENGSVYTESIIKH